MKKSLLLTVVLASSCFAGGDQFTPIDGEDFEVTRQQNEVALYFAKDPEGLKAQLETYKDKGDAHQFLYVISKRLIDQERYQDALGIALQVHREYLTPEMQDN
ncbi:MAG: hypothetical protein H2057_01415 [Alphaproteobacteria bacterium]|nr:hypothetical protein [Alphaproteobacteria bacterium]